MNTTDSFTPLEIDFIQRPLGGMIGLTHCPGRSSLDAKGRKWNRNLASDVATLKQNDITAVVSLLAQEELQHHGAGSIQDLLSQARISWLQFPISDFGIPTPEVTRRWTQTVPQLLEYLHGGRKVVIHCAAGYGRTGMMTAALLVAMGVDASSAIALVRAARAGTSETPEQGAFIYSLQYFSDNSDFLRP